MKLFPKTFLTLAAALLAVSGLASADSIKASLFSALPPSGTTPTSINLSGVTVPSHSTLTGTGYKVSFSSITGTQGVVKGNLSAAHAVPVAGVTGTTPEYLTGDFGSGLTTNVAASGKYFSTGTGTITFTFSTPQTSLALLWGSIDTGNSLTFNDAAHFVATGTAVQTAAGSLVGNGFQGPGGSSYVVVNTSTPFTTVTAKSSVVSFEFAAVSASATPFVSTPEPSSILLLGIGFGIVALIRRRQIADLRS
jgi:PEP-CTERM motif